MVQKSVFSYVFVNGFFFCINFVNSSFAIVIWGKIAIRNIGLEGKREVSFEDQSLTVLCSH